MSLWKWNDVELEIDMEDYDFLQKYERAFEAMGVQEDKLQKIGTQSEIMKEYCDMFYRLFDDIFGVGTGEKLFEGKRNVRICEECYTSFIAECKANVLEANKRKNAMMDKFKPNRAQRRKAGKK
ncbi:hypothetical protein EAI28_22895 [Faecalicatena contorta]|uniref:DUF6673 family protein n=1 Tax=Faecalicatena contorta TaxID=39482 RepID=UPI00129D3321|nr:DUF6673 family protein [Faecalicatena contorta]MRM91176.1 hypothetical protein [Faecalicatena contorta]